MIKQEYDDGKKHIHVLSYGGGTQSTALLLMALRGEVNGVIPDYIIFSDTGWEPKAIYKWIKKVNNYIRMYHGREIIIVTAGDIRQDTLQGIAEGTRFASLPVFTKSKTGEIGMIMRQCTNDYKVKPVKKKVRELLGYEHGQRVKEVVHMWKGISIDEIQRVKPIADKWIEAEHPLVDIANMDRSNCIAYVERSGLGTPEKSSCVGCPFHDNGTWLDMKRNQPEEWAEAVEFDKQIRNMPKLKNEVYLHRSGKPLDEVDLQEDQMMLDLFGNECEGMCGV